MKSIHLSDAPRFRGGVEVKTPTVTRKLKAEIAQCEDLVEFFCLAVQLIESPAVSHRLPKRFDKSTGQPKDFRWVVQSKKLEKIDLNISKHGFTPTCKITEHVKDFLRQQVSDSPGLITVGEITLLLSPIYASMLYGNSGHYNDEVVGVKLELPKTIEVE